MLSCIIIFYVIILYTKDNLPKNETQVLDTAKIINTNMFSAINENINDDDEIS
jgi:hypothetical protein